MEFPDSIKGRVVVLLIVFLSLSHLAGLWLYVQKSDEAATLLYDALHDALLAEEIALMVRVAERLPAIERRRMLETLSGPTVRMAEANSAALKQDPPAETDRIIGLEMGADDYVVKPFSPHELLARVKVSCADQTICPFKTVYSKRQC